MFQTTGTGSEPDVVIRCCHVGLPRKRHIQRADIGFVVVRSGQIGLVGIVVDCQYRNSVRHEAFFGMEVLTVIILGCAYLQRHLLVGFDRHAGNIEGLSFAVKPVDRIVQAVKLDDPLGSVVGW